MCVYIYIYRRNLRYKQCLLYAGGKNVPWRLTLGSSVDPGVGDATAGLAATSSAHTSHVAPEVASIGGMAARCC